MNAIPATPPGQSAPGQSAPGQSALGQSSIGQSTLGQTTLDQFLDQLGAKQPTPGGGAAASVAGAVGVALGQMVLAYSLGKKALAEHQELLEQAMAALTRARSMFLTLAQEDAAAYAVLNELMRLPAEDARRKQEWDAAVASSIRPPMASLALASETARMLVSLCGTTNTQLKSDLAIAGILVEAAAAAAKWNVVINVPLLPEADREKTLADAARMHEACVHARSTIEKACA